jgi:hypothetical protein
MHLYDNNYNIIEVNNESVELEHFLEHIKSLKNNICKKKETLAKDLINISPSFIFNELTQLKIDNSRFCFTIYQTVSNKQPFPFTFNERPNAILFARNGSKNESYILSLICKNKNIQKEFCKRLMEKLIEKAKTNNIKYIYVESTNNDNLFYKNHDSSEESLKQSEADQRPPIEVVAYPNPELSGYMLQVNKSDRDQGSDIVSQSDGKYYFNLYEINGKYIIELIKNNNIICKLTLRKHLHPQYMYTSLEIINIEGDINEQKILLIILDDISLKNYIYKTFIHINDGDNVEIYKELNYEHKKRKLPWDYYEKNHNDPVYIDRTILSYNFVI